MRVFTLGLVFVAGQALAGGSAPPPKGCSQDDQCGDGLRCVNGACLPSSPNACSSDDDCSGGKKCVKGSCTAPPHNNY